MAKSKKVVEEVVQEVTSADCTEMVSIAFDKNNNLYGVTPQGELRRYDWTTKKWEAV
jgi:hypothetical protein